VSEHYIDLRTSQLTSAETIWHRLVRRELTVTEVRGNVRPVDGSPTERGSATDWRRTAALADDTTRQPSPPGP